MRRLSLTSTRSTPSWGQPQSPANHVDDLLAVEAAVLDEDGSGVHTGNRAAGYEEARHVRLERLRVVNRRLALVQSNAGAAHQARVGPVPGQEIDSIGRDLVLS